MMQQIDTFFVVDRVVDWSGAELGSRSSYHEFETKKRRRGGLDLVTARGDLSNPTGPTLETNSSIIGTSSSGTNHSQHHTLTPVHSKCIPMPDGAVKEVSVPMMYQFAPHHRPPPLPAPEHVATATATGYAAAHSSGYTSNHTGGLPSGELSGFSPVHIRESGSGYDGEPNIRSTADAVSALRRPYVQVATSGGDVIRSGSESRQQGRSYGTRAPAAVPAQRGCNGYDKRDRSGERYHGGRNDGYESRNRSSSGGGEYYREHQGGGSGTGGSDIRSSYYREGDRSRSRHNHHQRR
jgi:hypothetical protein